MEADMPFEQEISPAIAMAARPLLVAAISSGNTDANNLTNMVFYTFYRGGERRPIRPDEGDMKRAWLDIRDDLVRPALELQTPAERSAYVRQGISGLFGQGQRTSSTTAAALAGPRVPPGFKMTKDRRGLARYCTQRLDKTLIALVREGKSDATRDQIDTFQRIANVETSGMITALNTWDNAVVSIGFMQWTLSNGELQKWIRAATAAFRRYGIEVSDSETYRFDSRSVPAIRGARTANELRWDGWAERFYQAGFDQEAIAVEVRLAQQELDAQLRWLRGHVGDDGMASFLPHYRTDPWLRAIFHETYNNRPVVARDGMKAAVARIRKSAGISTAEVLKITKEQIMHKYMTRNEGDKGARLIAKTARGAEF